jgi:hypothetical protein
MLHHMLRNKGYPLVMTDNTLVRGIAQAKTADLIEFLSDEEEIARLQEVASIMIASYGARSGYVRENPLKFVRFPDANNPNESTHVIVGGALVLQKTESTYD